MVWETDNNGRQRWCTRLVQGGGFASPLFDGFDNLYVGQPGAMLSFPPTQWIRWRQPVIGMPPTPRILGAGPAAGRHASGTGAGVRRPPRHRGRHVGGPGRRRRPERLRTRTRRLPTGAAALPGRGRARVLAGQTGMVVIGLWEPGADGAGAGRAAIPPRPDPAADPRVDQRCRRRRPDRQPGAVRRRIDGLRQRPRRAAVGAQHRRRQAEMVGAAGVSGADAAVGVTGRTDRGRRRARGASWSRVKTPATMARSCGAATTSPRCRRPAWPAPASAYTVVARRRERSWRCWCSIRATATRVNSYPLPAGHRDSPSASRSATTAASSPRPATARSTDSRPA